MREGFDLFRLPWCTGHEITCFPRAYCFGTSTWSFQVYEYYLDVTDRLTA